MTRGFERDGNEGCPKLSTLASCRLLLDPHTIHDHTGRDGEVTAGVDEGDTEAEAGLGGDLPQVRAHSRLERVRGATFLRGTIDGRGAAWRARHANAQRAAESSQGQQGGPG